MPFLAQLTPTPVALAAWLGCAAFLMGMVKMALDLWKNHFRSNPPSEVLEASATVISAKVQQLERAMEAAAQDLRKSSQFAHRLDALEHHREADVREASIRRKTIYDEIGKLRSEVTGELKLVRDIAVGVKTATELQNGQLARIENAVHRRNN